jgi:hydrogenase small subunit
MSQPGTPHRVSPERLNAVWLSGGGCDGCSVAALGAEQPNIESLLLGENPDIPPLFLVHPLLALESGDAYRAHLERAARGGMDPFVLVFEGSVMTDALAGTGSFSRLGFDGDQPLTTTAWLERLAPHAAAVVAIGSCATWGGIPAAAGNVTGAHGLGAHLGPDFRSRAALPVVNVPGCAPSGDVFIETLASVFLHVLGRVPLELDALAQPRWLYHEQTAPQPPETGYGPRPALDDTVSCPVPTDGWMRGIGGCATVGGACIGCTAPAFTDRFITLTHPHARH